LLPLQLELKWQSKSVQGRAYLYVVKLFPIGVDQGVRSIFGMRGKGDEQLGTEERCSRCSITPNLHLLSANTQSLQTDPYLITGVAQTDQDSRETIPHLVQQQYAPLPQPYFSEQIMFAVFQRQTAGPPTFDIQPRKPPRLKYRVERGHHHPLFAHS
jgi:hypothetical protein